jgi:hypothetical protein
VDAIVCSLRDISGVSIADTLINADASRRGIAVSLVMTPTPSNCRELLKIVRADIAVTPHLPGDSIEQLNDERPLNTATTPRPRMLSVIERQAPLQCLELLVASVAVGDERAGVDAVAGACQMSTRTVERQLLEAGLPPMKRLIALSVCLHALWRYDVLGWPAKRVAGASRIVSADKLQLYLKRHTGNTLSGWRALGGFDALFSQYEASVASRG